MLIFGEGVPVHLAHAEVDGVQWLSLFGHIDHEPETVRLPVGDQLKAQIRELVRGWDVAEMAEAHAAGCEPCRTAGWDGRHVTTVMWREATDWSWKCSCGEFIATDIVGWPTKAEAQDDADKHASEGPIFT